MFVLFYEWSNFKDQELVTQSYPTPRDPVNCSPLGSSVHGILQARTLQQVAICVPNRLAQSSYLISSHFLFSYPKITTPKKIIKRFFQCHEDMLRIC